MQFGVKMLVAMEFSIKICIFRENSHNQQIVWHVPIYSINKIVDSL